MDIQFDRTDGDQADPQASGDTPHDNPSTVAASNGQNDKPLETANR